MAEEVTATILFKEGFNSAFYDEGAIVLNLRGVPDDVTVTASMGGTGTALDPPIGDDNTSTTRRFSPSHVGCR